MSLYYSILANANSLLRHNAFAPFRRSLHRWPLLAGIFERGRFRTAAALLPDKTDWIQVESGLARGVWLHVNLQKERGYWLGLHETEVQRILERLCTPQSVFYDIGAHLGFFSLGVARRIGAGGKVLAFEPDLENCLRLKAMRERNNLQPVIKLTEAAVWSRSCPAGLPFRRGRERRTLGGVEADGTSPVLADGERISVPAVSLDDFVQAGHPLPNVLKIDVEGAECEVLKGGAQMFRRAKPFLICEVHHEAAARWISDWIAENGYQPTWRIPEEAFPRLLLAQIPGARAAAPDFWAG